MKQVGVIGMGTMGAPMAGNMAKAGLSVMVYNRTFEKAQPLVEAGAMVARTTRDLFEWADVVVLMLAGPTAIDEVLFGDPGSLDVLQRKVVANMGTVAPLYSQTLSSRLEAAGIDYVEAPVFGSKKPAEEGTLVVLSAGDEDVLRGLRPIFDAVGKKIVPCGNVPAGMATKLGTNLLLTAHVEALAEALHFVERAGGSPEVYLDVVLSGPVASDFYRMKAPKFLNRDYSPQASVIQATEGLRSVVETAAKTGSFVPGAIADLELYERAVESGLGDEDITAVVKVLESHE